MSNRDAADLHLRWSANPTGGAVTDGDMAQTSITGTPTCVAGLARVCYQMSWPATGTPVGTLSFEESNNHDVSHPTVTNGDWVAVDSTLITGLSSCHPAGSAGSHMITIGTHVFGGRFIRPKYTRTSGTGTINAWVHGS